MLNISQNVAIYSILALLIISLGNVLFVPEVQLLNWFGPKVIRSSVELHTMAQLSLQAL